MVPGQQVGFANLPNPQGSHAIKWSGTAASAIDLRPPGATLSFLNATCGSAQVGAASTFQYGWSAGIWFGTAQSFVPLAPYLPAGFYSSVAYGVTFHNGLYYVVGEASEQGLSRAILWVGIPAPGAAAALAAAGLLAFRPRRR
jgi:hypothetical protein